MSDEVNGPWCDCIDGSCERCLMYGDATAQPLGLLSGVPSPEPCRWPFLPGTRCLSALLPGEADARGL